VGDAATVQADIEIHGAVVGNGRRAAKSSSSPADDSTVRSILPRSSLSEAPSTWVRTACTAPRPACARPWTRPPPKPEPHLLLSPELLIS
jgi:hypothetical protein